LNNFYWYYYYSADLRYCCCIEEWSVFFTAQRSQKWCYIILLYQWLFIIGFY